MRTWTECATCSQPLQLTAENQTTHPWCDEPDDYLHQALKSLQKAAWDGDTATVDQLAELIETIDNAPVRLGEAAQLYATKYDWPVFPLQPGGKNPATRNGFKDATTDLDQIRQWWATNPHYNIGLPTGLTFDVIDVESALKGGGIWAWADFRDSPRCPDIHGWVTTPSGGFHVYVAATGGGNLVHYLPGIDYRGKGGYVAAPPSLRADHAGDRYRWAVKPSPRIHNTRDKS